MKPRVFLVLLSGMAALLAIGGCQSPQTATAPPSAYSTSTPSGNGPADQQSTADLPDSSLTPGATLPVTRDDICVPGYSQKVRNVPLDVKKQAYAEYGITQHAPGEYEVDHLISLELGGSNSLTNLWPQSYKTQPWNAHVKDALENKLHEDVCSGQVDLPTAQHEIATNWIAAYKKYFHTNGPLSSNASQTTDTQTAYSTAPARATSSGQVWVNLNSGKYFSPGAKYYGHTKNGQYMSEADAVNHGYVAAKGH